MQLHFSLLTTLLIIKQSCSNIGHVLTPKWLSSCSLYYIIIDSNEVAKLIYLPQKVIFTEATRQRLISILKVDKSLCLPKLKAITVLLNDFSSVCVKAPLHI